MAPSVEAAVFAGGDDIAFLCRCHSRLHADDHLHRNTGVHSRLLSGGRPENGQERQKQRNQPRYILDFHDAPPRVICGTEPRPLWTQMT
jgi:hypothetical protein